MDEEGNVITRILTRARSSRHLLKPQSTYFRVVVDGDEGDKDIHIAAEKLGAVIKTRYKYKDIDKGECEDIEDVDPETCEVFFEEGVFKWSNMKTVIVPWSEYIADVSAVYLAIENGACLTTTRSRLQILEEKFELYSLLNTDLEEAADNMRRGGGVFGQCPKVDTVRLATMPNASMLQQFIVDTIHENGQEYVTVDPESNLPWSLEDFLDSQGIEAPGEITVEGLGLHPPLQRKRFHRFDVFDEKFNAGGRFGAEILKIFLRRTGENQGRFFGEVSRRVLQRLGSHPYNVMAAETRIPFFGSSPTELREVASWIRDNGLNRFENNIWCLQLIRFSDLHTNSFYPEAVKTYGDLLHNLFYPMFMATLNPKHPDYTDIAELLNNVGSITLISDEPLPLHKSKSKPQHPDTIPISTVVNDNYFLYYVWANMVSLNALRRKRRLNTLSLVPTCGESAEHYDVIVSSYLMADAIQNGTRLRKSWLLQYIYMFHRIGIIMTPLASNALFVPYFENPFSTFFKRGLNVTLGTDGPLQFHHNLDPLVEEYATAMKIYQLTATDMSEIARNSVLISGFSHIQKSKWLGPHYLEGVDGNDIRYSNVCNFRLEFRHECLMHEHTVLNMILKKSQIVISKLHPRTKHVGPEDFGEFYHRRKLNYQDRWIKYPRIDIYEATTVDPKHGAEPLQMAMSVRDKYTKQVFARIEKDVQVEDVFSQKFPEHLWEYNQYYGVYLRSPIGSPPDWPQYIPNIETFMSDINTIKSEVIGNPEVEALAHHRLLLLEHKFGLHLAMNISKEAGKIEEKEFNNRDFFTAHKVDCSVHTEAGMNARTLLDFFVDKATNNDQDVVDVQNDVAVTLRELLDDLKINIKRITVDELQFLISHNKTLRELFLSTRNFMGGRYFAELTKRTLDLYKLDEFTFSENRLPIFGIEQKEWTDLAMWFDRYGMASSQNRWMIRLPRGYRKLRQMGHVKDFGEYLDNIFAPLWEVSLHPGKNTKFHYFLSHVSGFDCTDDESKVDLPLTSQLPHDWNSELNPPYNYYMYYYWANIVSLNEFRAARGLSTFSFRPQCGEQGDLNHLIGAFLVGDSINHGVTLAKFPAMEYLFYIAQIGISMSPLSNSTKSVSYLDNPFPLFFRRGLNVTLATNQPLLTHYTREPLLEEYSIAMKIWKLQCNDLCEIAKNSVQISGFPPAWKEKALGKLHSLHSTLGNDVRRSHVSDIRVAYRYEVYHTEVNYLNELLQDISEVPRAMLLLEQEVDWYQEKTGIEVTMPTEEEEQMEAADPALKVKSLRKEVKKLERECIKMQVLERQLQTHNEVMASQIMRLRQRMKTEPMAISADLKKEKEIIAAEGVESEGSSESGL